MWGGRWKLVNAASQRWSSMTKVLRRVLEQWWALRQLSLLQMCDKAFPLDNFKEDLEIFLALLEPVQSIITLVQASGYPTAAAAVLRLAMMRANVLNEKQPLKVHDYSGPAPSEGQQTPPPSERTPEARMVLHKPWTPPPGVEPMRPEDVPSHLTSRGKRVRECLKVAMDKRYFAPRYGCAHWSTSRKGKKPKDGWLLDMCVLVTPQAKMLDLGYIDPVVIAMGGQPGEASYL